MQRNYNSPSVHTETVLTRRGMFKLATGFGLVALGLPLSAYSCAGSTAYDTAGPFDNNQSLDQYLQSNHVKPGQTDTLQVDDLKFDPHTKNIQLRDDTQEPDNGRGNPADSYAAQGFTCGIETDQGNFVQGEVYVNNGLLVGDETPPKGTVDLDVVYTTIKGEQGLVARVYDGFPTGQ